MSPVSGSSRRCSIWAPSASWTSLKLTVLDCVAENSLIGTLTRPKEIVALKIERGTRGFLPDVAVDDVGSERRKADCDVLGAPRREVADALAGAAEHGLAGGNLEDAAVVLDVHRALEHER